MSAEAATPCSESQVQCVEEVFQRIASDLSMIADRELALESIETSLMEQRPEGRDKIHISFRLGFQLGEDDETHGCLLVPLPDAISLACALMMVPPEVMQTSRTQETLDNTTKDAMLDVGNFVCSATDAALRVLGVEDVKVVFEGCQGVRPDVRPAMVYQEGDPLVVGRAEAGLAELPKDTMILVLPARALGASEAL